MVVPLPAAMQQAIRSKWRGVALLGAYVYGCYPVDRSITIYGSEDLVLSRDKMTYTDNIHMLDGGNHAQFGDYGAQKGDGTATMTAEEQLAQTVQLLQTFMLNA